MKKIIELLRKRGWGGVEKDTCYEVVLSIINDLEKAEGKLEQIGKIL